MSGNFYVPFDPDEIEQARQMDLLTYLRLYELENLVHVGGNVYSTREHDSLKISNGKWYWWSRGFGGGTALDYLIKVRNLHFVRAVEILSGTRGAQQPIIKEAAKEEPKKLLLPPMKKDSRCLVKYLIGRGIDESLVKNCLDAGIIYESADYHNVVFIGRDEQGKPRYAACRGIYSDFKKDVYGSDKRYSFRLTAKEKSDTIHIFEGAIDLLSYATYLMQADREYKKENLLSLSGVYQPKREIQQSKIPVAISTFLQHNPNIKTLILHLDNDRAGRLAANTLAALLQKEYLVLDKPPPSGKDVNDFLMLYLGKNRAEKERLDAVCR